MTRLHRARISVRPHTPPSPYTKALIAEYASAPIPPSPPPSSLSPLSTLIPWIPSPPLLLPSLHTSHTYASVPLGYRAAMVDMPSQKSLCLTALAFRFKVRESSTAAAAGQTGHTLAHRVDYGFVETLDASIQASKGKVMTTIEEVNERVTELATTQRQDAHKLQVRANALAKHEANRNSRNGDDSHDSGSDGRRQVPTTRECTYSDFLKCQPLNFNGTKGVVGLTQWFEKMEYVFHISNYTVACQIKFATCTLLSSVLTWWNPHVKTVSRDTTYGMSWKTLKKMMTTKSLMCGRMFPEESNEVKKYVEGLLDMIQRSGMASKQKIMQEAIEFATELMDQKIRTFTDHQAENKRKLDDNKRNN
nr:hypothetical protein [Tanacetum cinerariifolium]